MLFTSNPAPLYPAIGWVGNLLLFAFYLCVLPRAPPGRCHRPMNCPGCQTLAMNLNPKN